METASTVIKDALQEILVQAQEQPIQAVDSSTAIRYMNRFMANLDAKGISLGYTVVSKHIRSNNNPRWSNRRISV